ncbi:MAG TPA: NADH-ubiquinone oxidoreductase-F iron-sulfur binding region domain-containing protein [Planctomycetota bacterium]|nr:NADH-ubiquinone oxidoreductase-F iron-sulfur binding region domain-containing protein [Planctomycetota bacterium]
MCPALLLPARSTNGPELLEEYRKRGGYEGLARWRAAAAAGAAASLVDEIAAAGLRGRGGAAFPTARKWRLAAAAGAEQKYVVANGGEHEPGSRKDQHLVEQHPHAVLEGLLLAGLATGANKGWLYLIEDMHGPRRSAELALQELEAAKLLPFPVVIHGGPTTYVAGEETAALAAIEGQPAKPRKKPPFPGEAGLFGKPTTVNNTETLAHVAWIARHGAEAFAAIGTAESKGTLLFTLGQEVQRPGVHELPFGSSYRQLIDGVGGGLRDGHTVRAVLPAMSCAFLPAEHLDVPIGYETLRAVGTSPGCGGVRIVDETTDVVALTIEIAAFFMREQCGQCPPCRMETNQFVHILEGVRQHKGPGYAEKLTKLADFARRKGFCSLIEMAAAPVLSAVSCFAADFAAAAGPAAAKDG